MYWLRKPNGKNGDSFQNGETFMSKLSMYAFDFSPRIRQIRIYECGILNVQCKQRFPSLMQKKTYRMQINRIQYEIFLF